MLATSPDLQQGNSSSGARPRRNIRERGSVLIVASLIMLALITLAGLSRLAAVGANKSTNHDYFKSIALYSAESGLAAGMDFLRKNRNAGENWSEFVSPNNETPPSPFQVPGNNVLNGESGNLFSPKMVAWYRVTIYNNENDTGFQSGTDDDARVILRSVGHGPDGSRVILEVDVRAKGMVSAQRPCPSYGQRNMSAEGAGRNDCLSTIEATSATSYRPGG